MRCRGSAKSWRSRAARAASGSRPCPRISPRRWPAPGTGDAQLSLTQIVRLHGALIVTTPQEMAVGDSLRGAKMFERVGVGVVGIVENMSYFVCPDCHARSNIFLAGGGTRLAAELGVPLLGQIPLQAGVGGVAAPGGARVVGQAESAAGE